MKVSRESSGSGTWRARTAYGHLQDVEGRVAGVIGGATT